MDLYQQNILDHYKKPHHKGVVEGGVRGEAANPLCGDRLEVSFKIEGNKVIDMTWQGEGCVLSLSTADILIDELIGKGADELKSANKEIVLKLIGTMPSPSRLKCALLVLDALRVATANN